MTAVDLSTRRSATRCRRFAQAGADRPVGHLQPVAARRPHRAAGADHRSAALLRGRDRRTRRAAASSTSAGRPAIRRRSRPSRGGAVTDGTSLFCNATPGVPYNGLRAGADVDTWLFADSVHPTTGGHKAHQRRRTAATARLRLALSLARLSEDPHEPHLMRARPRRGAATMAGASPAAAAGLTAKFGITRYTTERPTTASTASACRPARTSTVGDANTVIFDDTSAG